MALSNKNAEERLNGTPGNVSPKEETAVSDNSETSKQEEDSKHVDNFGEMFVEELRSDLLEFLHTCESCLGPRGRLKMTMSSTGNLRTTATSSRLWTLLQVLLSW